jgi:MFS family permease
MLLLVYAFNFIDRQIVGILAGPIKAELALSDTQLGLMGGLAFALLYTLLGIPIGLLADRRSRTWIMTIALTVWSGFTALCGLAGSFWQLFFARMGVGVGEAGGVAPAYSLIADYFPSDKRARALAIYSFGIPIGSAAGIMLGGWIAATIDWRTAFIVVGLAGLVLAPIFRLTVREPVRGRFDPPRPVAPAPRFADVLRLLARRPSFWLLSFGAGSCSVLGYGLIFWLPSFFGRTFGLSLVEVSLFYGSIVLVGGVIGIWAGGWLADRLGRSSRAAYARIPAFAFLAAVPCYAAGVLSDDLVPAFFLFLLPQALGLGWLGPVLSAVQHLAPPAMRSVTSAIFLFINNLIGIGFGTVVLGFMSDRLVPRFGDESLRYAILFGLAFYLLSAALFLLAARRLDRDWER